VDNIILSLKEVHSHIGQHHILQGVNLDVIDKRPTAILGRNGAGKSSTIRTIMGFNPLTSGTIELNGENIGGARPFDIARKGIGMVPEEMAVIRDLTVEENFRLAMINENEGHWKRMEEIWQLFPAMKKFWKSKAGLLSGGQKQMLAISRAFVDDRKILLIDEPSKGLAPIVVDQLGESLIHLREKATVILIEQNFYLASRVGVDYFILDDGRTVHQGSMADLINNDEIKHKYLGIG